MLKQSQKYPSFQSDSEGNIYNVLTGNLRKPCVCKSGYAVISSREYGTLYCHRIIADCWLPNPNNLEQVNHINGIKSDNTLSNLEWVTRSQNMKHAAKLGLLTLNGKSGEESNLSIYTDEEIKEVCELLCQGYRNVDITKKTGIAASYIKDIKAGKSRKDIASNYEFPDNRKRLSVSTIIWISEKIASGCSNKDILSSSTNKKISLTDIKNIKYKTSYRSISKDYF